MNPRIRRLTADYQQMVSVFRDHPFIRVIGAQGKPPEKYVLQFNIVGLVPDENDSFVRGTKHTAEIFLPLDYPRRPPLCRMTSPCFIPISIHKRFVLATIGTQGNACRSSLCGLPR
ncbi:MAG: hypothetical protein R3C05_30745 [Pirellulaceae bacterium]